MKDFFTTQKIILLLFTVVMWGIAFLWFLDERTYEPLLTFLAGSLSLIMFFFKDDQKGGIKMKNIKAGRDVKATDNTSQGIDAENVEAKQDVTLDES